MSTPVICDSGPLIALGIPVIGTVGVLVGSKQRGLLPAVKPLLSDLREKGYFIGDALIQTALDRCGSLRWAQCNHPTFSHVSRMRCLDL